MASEAVAGEDGGRELNTAAVIGAGTMGRQIAALIAGQRPTRAHLGRRSRDARRGAGADRRRRPARCRTCRATPTISFAWSRPPTSTPS